MSILSTILGIGGAALAPVTGGASLGLTGLSSVLGGAAKGAEASKLAASQNKLQWDKFAEDVPTQRARRALATALAENYSPQTVQWGGPGSGLKGELPSFKGGINASLPVAMSDPMVAELMGNVKAGTPAPLDSGMKRSLLDKILGGGALATSILGTLIRPKSDADSE